MMTAGTAAATASAAATTSGFGRKLMKGFQSENRSPRKTILMKPTMRPHVNGMNGWWCDCLRFFLTSVRFHLRLIFTEVRQTDKRTDGLADQRTDGPSYRCARMHLFALICSIISISLGYNESVTDGRTDLPTDRPTKQLKPAQDGPSNQKLLKTVPDGSKELQI